MATQATAENTPPRGGTATACDCLQRTVNCPLAGEKYKAKLRT